MGAGPITIGNNTDIYEYLGGLRVDGLLDLNGGSATVDATYGQLIQRFQAPHGPIMEVWSKEVQSAALSGATANVGTNFIPANSMPIAVSLFVTTAITLSAGTTWTAGDGTTADLFGSGLLLVVGDTLNVMKTATSPKWYASNTNLVLTGTGGNFTAGVVRAAMLYYRRGALLS